MRKRDVEKEKENTVVNRMLKDLKAAILEGLMVLVAAVIIGCPLKRGIGLSCPGCGITRACIHFVMGDIRGAFYYHPLFFLLPFVFLLYAFRNYIPKKFLNITLVIILVLYIGTYLYRFFVIHSPVTNFDFTESLTYTVYQWVKPLLMRFT